MFAAALLLAQLAQAGTPQLPPAGVVLPRGAMPAGATNGPSDMTFHRGTIQHDQKVFTIFWNPTGTPFPAGYQDTLNQFVTDLDGSGYYGIGSQYADGSGNITRHVTLAGTWSDTVNVYPTTQLSYADLWNEVVRAEQANGWTGDVDAYFQIYTAAGTGSSVGNICGLHYLTGVPFGQVLYPRNGCYVTGTTPNGTDVDSAINVSAHEILETLTDPAGGGWYHTDYSGEIGDLCAWNFGTRAGDGGNVTLGAHRYVVQQAWSNATSSCALTYDVTASPPSVIQDPDSQTINANWTVFFAAAAAGQPSPSVQWQASSNGGVTFADIAGATSTTLTFQTQESDNGRQFRAVFSNASGSATSNAATLTVTPAATPPTVTTQPQNASVSPGDAVMFTAAASGSPAPTVTWQYSLDNGTTWNAIADATSATLTLTASTADAGRQFRAVFSNSAGTQASQAATLTVRGDVPLTGDIDGDGKADLIVWRPSTGTWYWLTSSTGFDPARAGGKQWGNLSLGDVPLVGDVDGDGQADLIVWRASSGTWFALTSSSGYDYDASVQVQWGNASLGDVPLLADLDGDGKADLVVWRATSATWYWLTSSSHYAYSAAGSVQPAGAAAGDMPLAGDLDGDGRDDLALWRSSTGTWSWLTSSSGFSSGGSQQWGSAAQMDARFAGDVDGDGKADLLVWRPVDGTWYYLTSSGGYSAASAGSKQWGSGSQGDTPIVADIDGDGLADLVVWRPGDGTWYWLTSSRGYDYAQAGQRQFGSRN